MAKQSISRDLMALSAAVNALLNGLYIIDEIRKKSLLKYSEENVLSVDIRNMQEH